MKTRILSSLLFLAAILVLQSCEKEPEVSIDQQYVEALGEGDWTITSRMVNGEEEEFAGEFTEYTEMFNACVLAEGDCTGSNSFVFSFTNGGSVSGSSTYSYRIHDEGTKMTITLIENTIEEESTPCTEDCEEVGNIIEWSATKFKLEITDGEDVNVTTYERK